MVKQANCLTCCKTSIKLASLDPLSLLDMSANANSTSKDTFLSPKPSQAELQKKQNFRSGILFDSIRTFSPAPALFFRNLFLPELFLYFGLKNNNLPLLSNPKILVLLLLIYSF